MQKNMRFLLILFAVYTSSAFKLHSISSPFDQQLAESASLVLTPTVKVLSYGFDREVSLLNFPDVYQYYNYSSGHAALEGIFSYYQFPTSVVKYREDMFIDSTDFDQDRFASPENLVRAALRKLNNETIPDRRDLFSLEIKEQLTFDSLLAYIDRKIPPILLLSGRPEYPSGYYVIAIGYDETRIYFEDPSRLGSIGYLSRIELDSVWRSRIASEGRNRVHLGVIIEYKDGRSIETVPLVRPCP